MIMQDVVVNVVQRFVSIVIVAHGTQTEPQEAQCYTWKRISMGLLAGTSSTIFQNLKRFSGGGSHERMDLHSKRYRCFHRVCVDVRAYDTFR